jgi:glycosidase
MNNPQLSSGKTVLLPVLVLLLSLALSFVLPTIGHSQSVMPRIDPSCWWIGMNQSEVELMVYQPGIANFQASLNYPGVRIVKQERLRSNDYLFITLKIDTVARPGNFPILFTNAKKSFSAGYELKARDVSIRPANRGIRPADFIYLIMPDRFANGDYSNDVVKGTRESSINRDSMYWRHGGDLQGIIDKLDYLKDLGVTAVWLNPVQENDQPKTSYHGYAITDHYKIDKRLGTNDLYRKLGEELHKRQMKLVMDIVPNHIGNCHWWYKNLPDSSWVNWWPNFTRTNYRAPLLLDPYASQNEKNLFSKGWFDTHMPDLNQAEPHLARYLTQSYIWWAEYAGVDDFRIDTYSYPDQNYMRDMSAAILREYPAMNMFGEIWEHSVPIQSFFSSRTPARKDFDTRLPSVIDFQIYKAINATLTQGFSWTDGVSKMYYTLAEDYLYSQPMRNVNFLDNHDLSRFFSVVGEDERKFKMGMALLMTLRGIPSMYYGTEILMKGFSNPDGLVRSDFEGGWKADNQDRFTEIGRNDAENRAFNFVRKLANWRKLTTAVQNGKTIQFIPEQGMYVFFRYDSRSKIMVVINTEKKLKLKDPLVYDEILQGKRAGLDVINEVNIDLNSLELEPWEFRIIEIK